MKEEQRAGARRRQGKSKEEEEAASTHVCQWVGPSSISVGANTAERVEGRAI
jgi:hypothetical protein